MARLQSDRFAAEQEREARDRLEDAIRQPKSFARKPSDPAIAEPSEDASGDVRQHDDPTPPRA